MKVARLKPPQIILLSYVLLILTGTLLFLYTPATRREIDPIDAFFTATSAVTVTGLVVLDPGRDLNLWGQAILLMLIQTGGLGYMALTTFFLIVLGRRIGLRERLILAESLNYPGLYGLVRFLKRVVIFAVLAELMGFLLLLPPFLERFSTAEAVLLALFHAVSAFNNAGFSLFSDSLSAFRGDVYVSAVVMALVVLGGVGFFVINELYLLVRGRVKRLSTHAKLVLSVSGLLILGGWIALLMTEWGHDRGIWSLGWGERLLTTLFLSVSSRTAGFSTVDLAELSESSLFLIMMLMFIGASPGGTGGGIKTTTFAVIVLSVISYIRGSGEVRVFERSIGSAQIHRAMVILSLSILYVSLTNLLIDRLEERDFLSTLFEVLSAFSTVGLSVGNGEGLSFSAQFGSTAKVLIALSMIVGRVGILSFAMALIGREREPTVRRPEARLLI